MNKKTRPTTLEVKTLDSKYRLRHMLPRMLSLEMLAGLIALIAIIAMFMTLNSVTISIPIIVISGIVFTLSVAIIIRLLLDPDSVRARQTDSMLRLSSEMVDLTANGLDAKAAQSICELLLPSTAAIAVAITDREAILGYAGYLASENPEGSAIKTQATHAAIADGVARFIYTAEEIGFPYVDSEIKAAIIIPIKIGHEIRGTLKFYYKNAKKITETQKSIAQGFGVLLSTEVAASELEGQRKLATSMELKMLQNQINPHFLFNTINTIASLIRTDAPKARLLLRDFAVFYRSMLENSQDLILLSRELEQTQRYFSFEVARFGEDRLSMNVALGKHKDNIEAMLVPSFLLQPLVENAVKHAMPTEGKLSISITALVESDDVLVNVIDDGVGMDAHTLQNIMHPDSQTGLGIAVKNVNDRLHGYYGPRGEMTIVSEKGKGTRVTLRFPDEAQKFDIKEELDD